jgi:hypothetical protein
MKNSKLILGFAMIIAALMVTYLTNVLVRKYQLSPIVSIVGGAIGIGLLFWGSRLIARHKKSLS